MFDFPSFKKPETESCPACDRIIRKGVPVCLHCKTRFLPETVEPHLSVLFRERPQRGIYLGFLFLIPLVGLVIAIGARGQAGAEAVLPGMLLHLLVGPYMVNRAYGRSASIGASSVKPGEQSGTAIFLDCTAWAAYFGGLFVAYMRFERL
jgi:hypothetical protein